MMAHVWQEQLESYEPAIVDLTRRLVAVDTTNPPGRGYAECAQILRDALDALGLRCDTREVDLPGREPRFCLRAEHGSGARSLYLHGHYDVVPAQSPAQFAPELRDGRLWGRGSADMKGGLAAMIHAVAALRDAGVALDGRVVLQLVPDEEDGSAGGSAHLTEHGQLVDDGAIGMLTPEPTSGVVWNACRGAITQRITVHGRESHVGLLHDGDNAFERMVDVVQALRRLRDEVAERRTGYAIEPPAARRSILLLGGSASSGSGFNVVPARASFTLDRRPNPEEDLDAERARLAAVVDGFRADGYRIDVETLQDTFSAGCAEDSELAVALAESVEATEGARPAFELCPGVLEIRWYARHGIPAYAYGPGRLEVAHGPDEHVDVAALTRCAAVYAQTIERVLGTATSPS
jgi:succinyl-diaminopimelate desuccinylase